jgi:hypothetical protein
MGTFGETGIGTAFGGPFSDDFKYVSSFTLAVDARVTKLTVYIRNTGDANQALKGCIYGDTAGLPATLLAVASPVNIVTGAPADWVDMVLVTPVVLPAGTYWLGAATGPTANKVEIGTTAGADRSKYQSGDEYDDGPSDPFGTTSNDNLYLSIYASYGSGTVNTILRGGRGSAW